MQFFSTITPATVKAPNLLQMRLISYKPIIELGLFRNYHILAEFQYAHFTKRFLTVQEKSAKTIFVRSYLFEK